MFKDATFEISHRDAGGGVSIEHATLPSGVKLAVERRGCAEWNISYVFDIPRSSNGALDMKARLFLAADLIHETALGNQENVVNLRLLELELRRAANRQTLEPDEALLFQGALVTGEAGTYYSVGVKPVGEGRQMTVAYWTRPLQI